MRSLCLGLLLLPIGVSAQPVPPVRFRLVDIPVAPVGEPTFATAIGNAGHIIGSPVVKSVYRASRDGNFVVVPTQGWNRLDYERDVNKLGWVCGMGNHQQGGVRGFLWLGFGDAIDLCTVLGASYLDPLGMNDVGDICGSGSFPDSRGFVWNPSTGIRWLVGGRGNGINNLGQAVGSAFGEPAYWDAQGNLTLCGQTPTSYQSYAKDINDKGTAIVRSIGTQYWWTYLWRKDTGYTLVPPFPGSDEMSPHDINNHGWVVGYGFNYQAMDYRPFLYIPGKGTYDVSELVEPSSMAGWTLWDATGVNDSGEICGNGSYLGVERAFRLVPTKPPIPKGSTGRLP